ncbi:hypothetical protein PoB_005186100 [Plakobranchus ocellatus]|uniref:Uncharacterized protein n=1 Tax=Plakobranchus ocellatus TaxID=259542 RepID=A0AAV4BXT6_9GAST|nr:hypothetical protein PoB_005186100 [Plakobranchus ocellatus]
MQTFCVRYCYRKFLKYSFVAPSVPALALGYFAGPENMLCSLLLSAKWAYLILHRTRFAFEGKRSRTARIRKLILSFATCQISINAEYRDHRISQNEALTAIRTFEDATHLIQPFPKCHSYIFFLFMFIASTFT